jgi:hypothetical protein
MQWVSAIKQSNVKILAVCCLAKPVTLVVSREDRLPQQAVCPSAPRGGNLEAAIKKELKKSGKVSDKENAAPSLSGFGDGKDTRMATLLMRGHAPYQHLCTASVSLVSFAVQPLLKHDTKGGYPHKRTITGHAYDERKLTG